MTAAAQLAEHVNALVDGFRIRVEWMVDVARHTPACKNTTNQMTTAQLRHHTCHCPRAREARAETRRQSALLAQLRKVDALTRDVDPNQGGGRTKPGSKPPRSLAALALLDDIRQEATEATGVLCDLLAEHPPPPRPLAAQLRALVTLAARAETTHFDQVDDVVWAFGVLVKRARRTLGYDQDRRMRPLPDVSCMECGTRGSLIVRADVDSDVICTAEEDDGPCGARFPRWQWVELLEGQET